MQKFVPRSRVGIFPYERTRYTAWDTKHETHVLLHFVMFGCILDRFITARNLMQNGAELVQLMQKFVPRSCVRIFHNKRTRSTLLESKLMF